MKTSNSGGAPPPIDPTESASAEDFGLANPHWCDLALCFEEAIEADFGPWLDERLERLVSELDEFSSPQSIVKTR